MLQEEKIAECNGMALSSGSTGIGSQGGKVAFLITEFKTAKRKLEEVLEKKKQNSSMKSDKLYA